MLAGWVPSRYRTGRPKGHLMADTATLPKPVLKPGRVYLAHDRFVCATSRCAGMTALYTGRTADGARVRMVDAQDVDEWAEYDMGPLTCECGAQVAL